MLTSLALIFLIGLFLGAVCHHFGLPRIIGMLATGVILGPYALNLLDSSILSISADLRQMALVIILIKAGLSLKMSDLKKVGRPALMLGFLPACCEIVGYVIFAPLLLGITREEAALMGAVLAAVSPAVVVPRMVQFMEEGYGTKKCVPQMILAGASLDDIVVIVLFSTFLGIVQGDGGAGAPSLWSVPVSILLGLALGAATGWVLNKLFEYRYNKNTHVRNSVKVIIILAVAFLLVAVEDALEDTVAVSGLLAVMSMASVIAARSIPFVTERLSGKFGKLWLAAELVLFVMVGAAVDPSYTLKAGWGALAMILVGLCVRSIGTLICVSGMGLNKKEKIFCLLSYIPKATVQAAIGSVPLAMGLPCGNIILSVAVMGIVVSAPLGAICMDRLYKVCLSKDE